MERTSVARMKVMGEERRRPFGIHLSRCYPTRARLAVFLLSWRRFVRKLDGYHLVKYSHNQVLTHATRTKELWSEQFGYEGVVPAGFQEGDVAGIGCQAFSEVG